MNVYVLSVCVCLIVHEGRQDYVSVRAMGDKGSHGREGMKEVGRKKKNMLMSNKGKQP